MEWGLGQIPQTLLWRVSSFDQVNRKVSNCWYNSFNGWPIDWGSNLFVEFLSDGVLITKNLETRAGGEMGGDGNEYFLPGIIRQPGNEY